MYNTDGWLLMRDIPDDKQATTVLRHNAQRFRAIFDDVFEPISLLKLNGNLIEVNLTAIKSLGIKAEEAIDLPFWLAPCWSFSAAVQQQLQESIAWAAQGAFIHYETQVMGADNRLLSLDFSLTPIRDAQGETILIITQERNLSQIEQVQQLNNSLMLAQQHLEEQNEELSRFGFIIAHDLKAPLRAISNLSEWIEEDLRDRLLKEEHQKFQVLRQRVERMNALVDGLLNYSRWGRQALAIETVDVAQLLAEVIDSLFTASFQIEILSALPILATKRILLSQVFANLLSNAIKHHSRANGRIEITTEDLGDRYQFSIADDGDGIPMSDRQRIFDMFQTLKIGTSNENTGIGLALVKKIVEGEGGQIWVADCPSPETDPLSQRLKGACFCFTWLKPNNVS